MLRILNSFAQIAKDQSFSEFNHLHRAGVQPSVQSSEASSNEPNQQRNSEGLRPAARSGDGDIDAWNKITWLPSMGWTWHQKSPMGPVIFWSIGDQSGATAQAYRLGQYATHPQPPEACAIPCEFVDERYGNPNDSSWSQWLPKIESRDDANAEILMKHRTQPWREIRIHYDVARKCALQQDTLVDGEMVSRIKMTDHVQIGGFCIAGRIAISEFEPMSGNIVTVTQHALELQEISKEDATKVLKDESSRLASSRRALEISQDQPNTEWIRNPTSQGAVGNGDGRSEDDAAIFGAHQTEHDGNIVLPEQLPTVTAVQNAIDAGTATIVDQLTFVFQLWHQARWDEAISLLDRTLAVNEATESGQWIRRFLLLDARRMDALKSEVSAAFPKSLETPQPVSHDDVELVIARLFSLKTFAR